MSIESNITTDKQFHRGEAKSLVFTISGTADASAWTIEWRIYKRDMKTLIVTVTDLDIDANEATVNVAAADTKRLDRDSYWHELWRTDAGSESKLAHGALDLQ